MERHPGVFVSKVSTSDWESDPEVGGLMHVFCSQGRVQAGMSRWDKADGPVEYTPPERETILILEGRAHIDIEGSSSIDLEPGDLASLPKGVVTTWTVTAPFREFWVFGAE